MRGRSFSAVLVAVAAALALAPGEAWACPVCFDRDDEARVAFLATTGLLTLLPLGMVGGAVMWVRRRGRDRLGKSVTPPDSK